MSNDEQTEGRWTVLYRGANADADFEDGGSHPYASEFDEPTDEYAHDALLSWWQRRKLVRAERRDQRREDRALKRATRALMKAARKKARSAVKEHKQRERAARLAREQKNTQPLLFMAGQVLQQVMRFSTSEQQQRIAAESISDGFTKQRDRRFKYVAAFGTWLTLLAIAAMLTMCGSCTRYRTKVVATMPDVATDTHAVMVATECVDVSQMPPKITPMALGSGTLVDGNTVITAGHVVTLSDENCPQPSIVLVNVAAADNVMREVATVTKLTDDVAVLTLVSPILGVTPLKPGHSPKVGDTICTSSMHPNYERRCAEVKDIDDSRVIDDIKRGEVWFGLPAIAGNSGSGIYNTTGELIGVLIARQPCAKDLPLAFTSCGAYASMLDKVTP